MIRVEALSNLRSKYTGVEGAVTWISAGEFNPAEANLGPRIVITLGPSLSPEGLVTGVTLTITEPPKVLGLLPKELEAQATAFVALNRRVLLRHWKGELDALEVIKGLLRVAAFPTP